MGGDPYHGVDEHEVKHELINKLRNYYHAPNGSLITRTMQRVKHILLGGHHAHINTEGYEHLAAQDIPAGKQVNRTVYALKKIKEFNHHYFKEREIRVLSPLEPGIFPIAMNIGFAAFNAVYLLFLYKQCSFNKKSLGIFAVIFGAQQFMMYLPNSFNEGIQYFRRKQLAQNYLDQYGYEYFHTILDPNCDLNKIKHLHNKIY